MSDYGLAVDQAAGLRRWAQAQTPEPAPVEVAKPPAKPKQTLMVVGLPDDGESVSLALNALQYWQQHGHAWLSASQWRVVAVDLNSPHVHTLACQQPRWALWVDDDLGSFRRAYYQLRRLRDAGGPTRLLALHAGYDADAGLLANLRHAAAAYLGIDLLLLTARRSSAT